LIDIITHIIIEDANRKEFQATRKKKMTTKANLVKWSSHKKGMSINLIIIIIILSPMITIPICSNPNPIIFRKKKLFCVWQT